MSKNTFNQESYSRKKQWESIFGEIKRIFDGTNRSKVYKYQIKKQNSKTQSTTFTD